MIRYGNQPWDPGNIKNHRKFDEMDTPKMMGPWNPWVFAASSFVFCCFFFCIWGKHTKIGGGRKKQPTITPLGVETSNPWPFEGTKILEKPPKISLHVQETPKDLKSTHL